LQEAPKDQWIQIPVPALVDERIFELAQERLQDNKKFSPRRTVEPSILQGLVHCAQCGYALYRHSARSSARKISYYRCLGSDAWRYQGQARCSAQPIRLDLLEDTVWTEVARLLEDPALIQAELTRRVEAARTSHPAKQNQDRITRELLQAQRRADRLLTAYQEDLLSLDELRRRMPELRQRETRLKAELESLSAQLADQATYLRLAHTLGEFLERLRTQARGLDVLERQRVVRLLVKEVVVGDDSITIRHSIPNSNRSSGGTAGPVDPGVPLPSGDGSGASSLLRTWRERPALRRAFEPLAEHPVHEDAGLQVAADQPQHPLVRYPLGQPVHQDVVIDPVEEFLQIQIHHDPVAGLHVLLRLQHRALRASPRPEAVAVLAERRVDERLQHLQKRLLDQSVDGRGYPELARPAPRLGYAHAAHG